MTRSLILVLASLPLLAAGSGCDGRVRAIRAELSEQETTLFDRGQRLSTPCWSCHDFYGSENKIGPPLSGIFGRRAGDTAYPGYSAALRDSGLVWDERSLSAFLANPGGVVPGTNMLSAPVASPEDRRALVFYMRKVTMQKVTAPGP